MSLLLPSSTIVPDLKFVSLFKRIMNKTKLNNLKASLAANNFKKVITDQESALKLLSEKKWHNGFVCIRCNSTNYCRGKSSYSRRCTRCKKVESATANTIFHRCKIPINSAMEIAYLVCNVYDISSYEISRQLDIRHMTCYGFQKKVLNCMDGKSEEDLLQNILEQVQGEVSRL
mgnify:FL=1